MPVTGNMDQDQSMQDSTEQSSFVGSSRKEQCVGSIGGEVSSTTTDSDFVSQTAQGVYRHRDNSVSEHVQSTSVDAPLDSGDDVKDNIAVVDESVIKSSSANLGFGFQDVFAAFASASYHEAAEESPGDDDKSIHDAEPETTIPSTSNISSFPAVDSSVSSTIDSVHVTSTAKSFVTSVAETETLQNDAAGNEIHHPQMISHQEAGTQSPSGIDQVEEHLPQTLYNDPQMDTTSTSESVYFIQTTDSSGQVVTSIIDPNDIPSYTDSVVYKQCMRADGEIETTIVYSAALTATQEEQPQEPTAPAPEEVSESQHQIIYVHDINGHLTPIDSTQSFNDVAPPGKQFVYMQDSTGRIIRTVMDADQTMVPGQQVYYTQSDDGRIITSVMDPAMAGESEEPTQCQQSQNTVDQADMQQPGDAGTGMQQQETSFNIGTGASNFNIDNNMSGLTMLAELSHLTSGQAYSASGLPSEHRAASSTDSNSLDQEEFRPIATVSRPVTCDEGLESVRSDIADLKVEQEETLITRIMSQISEETLASLSVSRDNLFVQWQNLDAMCWMDVILIMLVNSPSLRSLVSLDPSHELSSTLLITLLKANRQAQILLQNILKKNNSSEINNLQKGAGSTSSIPDPKTSKLVCKENMDEIGKAINILYAMREKIWQALQPRLLCERGKHNSPVLVLPLIIREKPAIKQMFTMSYKYVFKCKQCEYSQDDSQTKILPSIPAVPNDFNMQTPCFVRNCFECSAPDQRMFIKFEILHDFVQMHFVKGLPHNRFDELNFDFKGDHYQVTAIVHYKNNPDHFIAWVRNAPGSTWMECDDLKSVITCYSDVPPNIPPAQVHMVMWERRLTPQHTLVMRDTEDTKLLASLMLTVQQPGTQQSTEQAAKASGVQTNQATAALTPATTSSQPSLQAGTMTSLTPRPRGRGRGRGSFAVRGQTTSTPIIRRVTPTLTQLSSQSSTSSVSHTSPQIIRLPLSALGSSGLNLRGGASAGARYVLVGNNSQSGARGSAVNKVVVVRSQGGNANISATQLLQWLQRSGAISQAGTRITTTVTTSGANSSSTVEPSTTSYIIQQDGTIMVAPTNAELGLSQSSSGTSLLDLPTSQQQDTITTDSSNNKNTKSSITSTQTISTLPYVVPTASMRGQASTDQPQEVAMSTSSSSQTELSTSSSDDAETTADQTVSLTSNQQPTRYIQVPNPAGGGMLLCQLGTKDGKTVLVPVDKNSQTLASGTSILKLSNAPSSSSPRITIRVPTSSAQVSTSSLAQVQQNLLQGGQSGASPSHHFITVPGMTGNKKIQLTTVPRVTSTSQTSSPGPKTIIMSGQQPSAMSRLVSTGQGSLDSRALSQSGNIVIREIKQTDSNNVATPSLAATGHSIDTSLERVASTQTVSVFKHMPTRFATSSMSLLTSPTKLQKSPENFRYILPGSNTTHILHTGPTGGLTGQAGRAFTALSSSGTIIGGQLTPSPTYASVETSPINQDMADSDDNDQGGALLTPRQQLSRELDTTEYIPLGRGRSKARAQRGGKGQGGRTPRGRGSSQLWSSEADIIAPVSASSHKISTLADLRQVGAHVIDASSEIVDGVPVVSIPDFSTDRVGQREILSAAQSISENASGIVMQGTHGLSDSTSQFTISGGELENPALSTSPRVITQPVPSYIQNHGYDILTQGILGANITKSPSVRQARSLLTGATTTLPATSQLVTSLAEPASSLVPAAQQTIGQAEIDTLIQAAQAAAKPPTSAYLALVEDIHAASTSIMQGGNDFSVDDTSKAIDVGGDIDVNVTTQSLSGEQDGSMDECRVSAAERYEMPVELFQPDEGSPIKSARADDLPFELLDDPEASALINDAAKTSQKKQQQVGADQQLGKVHVNEAFERAETSLKPGRDEPPAMVESGRRTTTIEESIRDEASMEAEPVTDGKSLPDISSTPCPNTDNFSATSTQCRPIAESDVLLQTSEEAVTSFHARKKVGRHRKSRGNYKRQGRKKSKTAPTSTCSDISSPPLSDASPTKDVATVVLTDPSPERIAADINLEDSPDTSPLKYCKQNSANASFGSDLLLLKPDDEREPADGENSTDIFEVNRQEEAIVVIDQTQQKLNINMERKEQMFAPAFVRHRKEKVNWGVQPETDETEVWPQPNCGFNYRVLTGKSRKPHFRHPSLSALPEYYISEPTSLTTKTLKQVKPQEHLAAVVVSRRTKHKERSDPVRMPTVIPLFMEDNSDPCCTGGSVVTSLDGTETFTGVIVRHRRERTHFSSSMAEDEEVLESLAGEELKMFQREFCQQLLTVFYIHAGHFGDISHEDCLAEDEKITVFKEEITETNSMEGRAETISREDRAETFSGEDRAETFSREGKAETFSGEDRAETFSGEGKAETFSGEGKAETISREDRAETISREDIAETISSKDIGDVSSMNEVAEMSALWEEGSEKTDASAFEKQTGSAGMNVFVDNLHAKTASSKDRKKKRKQNAGLTSSPQPTKKTRISQEGETDSRALSPSHPTNCPTADLTDASFTAVPTRVNGTDIMSSPSSLSQTLDSGHIQQRDKPVTAQPPFHSPSRRSGRTPIPSKKFLDALEEYPILGSAFVDRRTLSLSSDEELSGLASGDMRRKKQKTKQTFSAT